MANNRPINTPPKPAAKPAVIETINGSACRLVRKGPLWSIETLNIADGVVVSVSQNAEDVLTIQLAKLERIFTKAFQ